MKRTILLDDHDEALIARIAEKHRPFARPHRIAQLALRHGLRVLDADPSAVREREIDPSTKTETEASA